MPHHAAPKRQARHRSPRAEQAYLAGAVTRTIDITQKPAVRVRQRAVASLNRHALALGVVAMAFTVYDIGLLVRS